jgi:hypothetical protein
MRGTGFAAFLYLYCLFCFSIRVMLATEFVSLKQQILEEAVEYLSLFLP